jgi:glucose/mannose-6-phosphate isomerase
MGAFCGSWTERRTSTHISDEQDPLSPREIKKVDGRKLYELYESWPARAEESLRTKVELKPRKYGRVVFLAVGGSATSGDIISDWFLSSGGAEVSVFRGYLPKMRLDDSLVVVCSTSGDTEETLRMANMVIEKNPDMVAISAGGKLMEFAESRGIEHVKIKMAEMPRFSLPHSLFASIAVLRSASLLEGFEWELDEAMANFRETGLSIAGGVPTSRNPAKSIASEMADSVPSIYAASVSKSVAARFKNSLNENAKMHAYFDYAPDLFHNEVEAWQVQDERQQPIFLRRHNEPPFESKSLDIFYNLLAGRGVKTHRADAIGRGNLSQLITLCYTLDVASYYVAILRGVNPYPIDLIGELKTSR